MSEKPNNTIYISHKRFNDDQSVCDAVKLGRSRRAGLTGISNTNMERVAKETARVLYVAGKTHLLLAAL